MTKLIKTISVLLALLMIPGVVAVVPITASAEESGDYEYSITTDGTVTITRYSGSETNIIIPSEIEGKTVASIGAYAFNGCIRLASVIIPNVVTSIGGGAFSYCQELTSINIPDSVTSIGEEAFYGCTGLTSITIPDSVTSIGLDAFKYCRGLKTVTLPQYGVNNKIKNIFDSDNRIEKVIISNSVTSIGDYAFDDCTRLTSVNIPNSVTSIGESAFSSCIRLTSVKIPNSVISIGSYAFTRCHRLTSITIPDSVTDIGKYAFDDCAGLKTVTLSKCGVYLFKDIFGVSNRRVENIIFSNSVTNIVDGVFKYCTSLKSIKIPDSVTNIGDNAFYGCTSMTSVTIPKSVTTIGDKAFGYYDIINVKKIEGFTIYGYKGSAAENYARNNNFIFVKLSGGKKNPVKMTVKTKTVKLKMLKKKPQTVKAITIKGAKGRVTFKLVKSKITNKIRKYVRINSKGVITFKKWKKAKKGTYLITVTVKAAGNTDYKAKTITKTVKVKVK